MRDFCFRSFMDRPPPPQEAWDGSTPEHVNQRIEEQREMASRRQVLPDSMQNDTTVLKKEVNRLQIELERAFSFIENVRREKQQTERKYDDLVDQFNHHGKRMEELSQQLFRERELGERKTEDISEYGIKLEEKVYELQTLREEYNTLQKDYVSLESKYNKVLKELNAFSSEA